MTRTAAAPGSPRWSDHRSQRAGEYTERTGLRKNIARAHGLSPQRISQIVHGDHTGAPQRWFEFLEQAARGGSVNPWPYITGSTVLVTEIEAEQVDDLWHEIRREMEDEAQRQAEEDVAWHHLVLALSEGDDDDIENRARAFIRAGELEVDRQARALGLTRVYLRRRGVLL